MDTAGASTEKEGIVDAPVPAHERREVLNPEDPTKAGGEIPIGLVQELRQDGFALLDTGIVTWTDHSASHPNRWSMKRKLFDTSVILFFEFFTWVSSSRCLLIH